MESQDPSVFPASEETVSRSWAKQIKHPRRRARLKRVTVLFARGLATFRRQVGLFTRAFERVPREERSRSPSFLDPWRVVFMKLPRAGETNGLLRTCCETPSLRKARGICLDKNYRSRDLAARCRAHGVHASIEGGRGCMFGARALTSRRAGFIVTRGLFIYKAIAVSSGESRRMRVRDETARTLHGREKSKGRGWARGRGKMESTIKSTRGARA